MGTPAAHRRTLTTTASFLCDLQLFSGGRNHMNYRQTRILRSWRVVRIHYHPFQPLRSIATTFGSAQCLAVEACSCSDTFSKLGRNLCVSKKAIDALISSPSTAWIVEGRGLATSRAGVYTGC